jgi:hypothetical protein
MNGLSMSPFIAQVIEGAKGDGGKPKVAFRL